MVSDDFKARILYVDDEEENLMVFKSAFRRNYQVSIAQSVAEANVLLNDHTFDIIISDQRMPDTTGVEFLKNLADTQENIKMILTGFSDMEAIIDAMNSGKIYKYITKPWQRLELQKVLDEALKHSTSNKNQKEKLAKVSEEIKILENLRGSPGELSSEAASQLELLKYKEAYQEMSRQLDESNKNVQLLSEIGQEIISNLHIDAIIDSTYEYVNDLMDANVLGIGIYNNETRQIVFPGYLENGEKLPFTFSIDDENRYAVWCYKNGQEIFINDNEIEHTRYIAKRLSPKSGNKVESIIYLPLKIKDTVIGVMTAQSYKKNAYSTYHLNILRNISIYVATALENAKAYQMIELQKSEIEHKNLDLEEKVQQRTLQFQQKNDELVSTYNNVKLLSEIGQQITATLSLEKIIETVYENVNKLMDASVFAIGVYNQEEQKIEMNGTIEKGEKLPYYYYSLDDDNRNAVWCFKNQKEVIINDYEREYNKYIQTIPKTIVGERPESLIFLPLVTESKIIGIISVQSFKKHSYNNYHLDILRSLASYVTIALQNSTSYLKMTKAFEDLKAAQMKLVEAEKMASLGVLTAGVAHEINNPVNFISAGIDSLELNYEDVEKLLSMYLQYHPKTSSAEDWDKIEALRTELHPEDLLPEIAVLINSIKSGAKRTSEIVLGLKNFTRLDENDMKLAKLEEGIDNTLVILNNKLKNKIEVIKEYGDTPPIICYPGQLNQVFMNMLHNASDAIETKGTITIKTWTDKHQLHIRFTDTGKGMPKEIQSHIFEPFYTTKEVGKGTGLGLSITYGIIEKHYGKIEVDSTEGVGTTFTISLPLKN